MSTITPAATTLATSSAVFTPIHRDLAALAASLSGSRSLGLARGARILVSNPFREALTEVDDVLADRAIVLIDGPPGSGKTLLQHLLMARATQLGATAVRVQAGPRPSGKQLSAAILAALEPGCRVPKTQNQTEDQLKKVLAPPRDALVVYDEVQNLGVKGIEAIRYYWDETPDRFPLILSGVKVNALLSGHSQLEDRISYRYRLDLLSPRDSVAFAVALHPLLADIAERDRTLLDDINHCGIHGTPRRWSTFLTQAQHQLARVGGTHLTAAVAFSALARFVPSAQLQGWTRERG
jgi:type II secretory pathway predicted ATPase ExeA